MTTMKKYLLLPLLALLVLTGFRLLWLDHFKEPPQPAARQGVFDLRGFPLKDATASLIGEWEYYPGVLLEPDELETEKALAPTYRELSARNIFAFDFSDEAYQAGTYRLRIQFDSSSPQAMYGLSLPPLSMASRIYVNGEYAGGAGIPSTDPRSFKPQAYSQMLAFHADRGEADILVQVSGNLKIKSNVMESPIHFGTFKKIEHQWNLAVGMQLLLIVVLFLHAIYAAILYLITDRNRTMLYFLLLLVCAIYAFLVDDAKLLNSWADGRLSFIWGQKLLLLSYLWLFMFINILAVHLTNRKANGFGMKLQMGAALLYSVMVMTFPLEVVSSLICIFFLLIIVSFLMNPVILIRYYNVRSDPDGMCLLITAVAIVSSASWGTLRWFWGMDFPFYPFDLVVAFLSFATYWFRRFQRSVMRTEMLARELRNANKAKDGFLANTSHELRNPLHGMMNIAGHVLEQERGKLDPDNEKNLELLLSIGNRMTHLLNDLLDLSLLKESRIRLNLTAVALQPIIERMIDQLSFPKNGKPLELRVRLDDSFPCVLADEERLMQILFNLIHNAIKFTEEGTVLIEAEKDERFAYVHVSDTGIGMDEVTVSRIFRPSEQEDSEFTEPMGGIGLGLSICSMLVKLHGGELYVKSKPGHGSVFSFSLPLAPATEKFDSAAGPDAQTETVARNMSEWELSNPEDVVKFPVSIEKESVKTFDRRPRILAADDDPVNLKVLATLLPPETYELAYAVNGVEALRLLERGSWDLVITDVMMPKMSGYELTREIRKRYSMTELPVLLLTARTRSEDIEEGFRAGANDYMLKPIDGLELLTRVDAQIKLKRSIAERLQLEAAYLQAQMHPHFLFNALNSISALAEIDVRRMGELLHALSDYLRISFHSLSSEELVPIEHELDLVRAYLYIEQERFGERLNVVWDLEEGLRFQLPPLTLQPLVENAVRHGILEKVDGGTIIIRTRRKGDEVELSVIDDGIGMDAELKCRLLTPSHGNDRGVGIINTDRRLKRLCGQGLQIESEPGVGTRVSFTIWLRGESV
ncbi:hybrid sensor histidine kinase/response regulator [Gorillibacterium timonense]|uniref:hybrid sensor histidine kinase/response regulator n=1 Tax=Gorillibacterium timonense TaxID=1689269 RepID=UPI00131DB9F8|nr:ATP-binding protein [Gorillibacterium timonense]